MTRRPVVPRRKVSALPYTRDEVWGPLREAYRLLRQRWATSLGRLDLSLSEYGLLELCTRAPARASEVARAIGITPAGATDVIDRLEGRQVIRRAADPEDRRAVLVRLTPRGRRLYREAKGTRRAFFEGLLAELTLEERRSLFVGLTALVRAVPREPD